MPKKSRKATTPRGKAPKPPAPKAAPSDSPGGVAGAGPDRLGHRATLRDALEQMRANLRRRRELFHALPRRGYPTKPPPQTRSIVYLPPLSGGRLILQEISAGNLELITAELLEQLIAELSHP